MCVPSSSSSLLFYLIVVCFEKLIYMSNKHDHRDEYSTLNHDTGHYCPSPSPSPSPHNTSPSLSFRTDARHMEGCVYDVFSDFLIGPLCERSCGFLLFLVQCSHIHPGCVTLVRTSGLTP